MSVNDALAAARRLRSCGAMLGAGQVAFNALLISTAAARAKRTIWTPGGPLPLPANDRTSVSMSGSIA